MNYSTEICLELADIDDSLKTMKEESKLLRDQVKELTSAVHSLVKLNSILNTTVLDMVKSNGGTGASCGIV